MCAGTNTNINNGVYLYTVVYNIIIFIFLISLLVAFDDIGNYSNNKVQLIMNDLFLWSFQQYVATTS